MIKKMIWWQTWQVLQQLAGVGSVLPTCPTCNETIVEITDFLLKKSFKPGRGRNDMTKWLLSYDKSEKIWWQSMTRLTTWWQDVLSIWWQHWQSADKIDNLMTRCPDNLIKRCPDNLMTRLPIYDKLDNLMTRCPDNLITRQFIKRPAALNMPVSPWRWILVVKKLKRRFLSI